MLNYEKLVATQRLIDVVLYIFNNDMQVESTKAYSTKLESGNDRYYVNGEFNSYLRTLLLEDDGEWFIIAVHPDSVSDKDYRKFNTYINTLNDGNHFCTVSSMTEKTSGIGMVNSGDEIEALRNTTVDAGTLFQTQTAYNDLVSFCLVLEVYLRDKIKDHFYVPINIQKLLLMETYRIEEITNFWQEYIEAYGE